MANGHDVTKACRAVKQYFEEDYRQYVSASTDAAPTALRGALVLAVHLRGFVPRAWAADGPGAAR
jgi:hypothetical protein